MRNAFAPLLTIAFIFGVAAPVPAVPGDAAQLLLARAWENLYAGDFIQVMVLTNRARSGRTLSRKLQIVRKQSVAPGKALVRFLEPPDIRGTSLLVLERAGRDDDLFLFLPALDRARRVTSSQRSDAFFGTNLTYEDLEPKHPDEFTARFSERGRGDGCIWLEIRPRPDVPSQYERILSCIEESHFVVLRSEYYVAGRLEKRLEADAASVEEFQGRHLPLRARIVSFSNDVETLTRIESFHTAPALPDSLFTIVNLESGSERGDRAHSAAPDAERPR